MSQQKKKKKTRSSRPASGKSGDATHTSPKSEQSASPDSADAAKPSSESKPQQAKAAKNKSGASQDKRTSQNKQSGKKPKNQQRTPRMVAAERIAKQRAKEHRKTVIYRSLIALVLLAAAGVIGYAVYKSQGDDDLPNMYASPAAHYAVPSGANKEGITVGNADAPVTVDLYVDYQCPHCRDFEAIAAKPLNDYVDNGTIKVVYHPIAILSGYSVWGSAAAGCAADEGKFREYSQALFDNQSEMRPAALAKLGKKVGLTSPKFQQCVKKVKYENWTLGMRKPAQREHVQGTPTVLLNHQDFSPNPSETLKSFVNRLETQIDAAAKKDHENAAQR